MMSIQQIEPALLFDSNMYLISGSDRTALIDTGTGFMVDATIKSLKELLAGRDNLETMVAVGAQKTRLNTK